MTPRDLVCTRCWRDFFDTEAFEKCCTGNHLYERPEYRGVEVVATVGEIRDADCTWCSYIKDFIRDSWMPNDRVATCLSPSLSRSCTPRGQNVFHLSISCSSPTGKWIGGSSLFLHAWTATEDIASAYVTARPFRTDVNSESARLQFRTWSEECIKHEGCSGSQVDSILPTRVIEINPPGRQHPRILESRDMHGIYATLSYCWGETPFSTLTRSNYINYTKELDLQTLPLAILDSISTTRDLGIPYLWVDALCIIQDSEEDKIGEMGLMKRIYASSTLTIVAASARNISERLVYPRVYSETFHKIPFRTKLGGFGTMSVNELDGACYDERLEPIAKRAWTLQEQLLAQRTVTFTSRTIMWRCQAGTRNFGDSLYFPHDLDSGYNDNNEKYSLNLHSLLLSEEEARSHKDKTLSCWLRLATAYSLRAASLERDKLNAVAGIASHSSFSHALGPGYYAGLWQYHFARQLMWRSSRWHRTLPENGTCIIYRPVKYRAPSWSWASLEGGVIHFDFSFDDEDEIMPEIICDVIECVSVSKYPG